MAKVLTTSYRIPQNAAELFISLQNKCS